MRKKSLQSISKIQRLIWEHCRRIAKVLYKNDCYTCPATNLQGNNCQLGHLWAKASLGAWLKYDLRILRWQCMRCNQFLGGMGAVFYSRMIQENGKKYMEKLEAERGITVKAMDHYIDLLEKYANM